MDHASLRLQAKVPTPFGSVRDPAPAFSPREDAQMDLPDALFENLNPKDDYEQRDGQKNR